MSGSVRDLERAVHLAVEAALAADLDAVRDPGGRPDLLLTVDDKVFIIEVKAAAYVTPDRARRLLAEGPVGEPAIVVADRVAEAAADLLGDAGWGWLDSEGRFVLRAPGVRINTEVPPPPVATPLPRRGIIGRRGRVVAYRLLTRPDELITTTKSALGLAPSSVSEALRDLRAAALLSADGEPILPELFWELADAWVLERVWLRARPTVADARRGPQEPEWKLTGTKAAAALGAPAVAGRDVPLDLYVPGPVIRDIAARRYGPADPAGAVASIAVAPVPEVAKSPSALAVGGWPVAHPVAVALDLAQDRARGREILDAWDDPHRVW